jgi:thiol-disulfide isomerase/thioredoxin
MNIQYTPYTKQQQNKKYGLFKLSDPKEIYTSKVNGSLIMIKAIWCGYCAKSLPEIAKLAREYPVYIIDESETKFKSLIRDFEVSGFPTFIFVKDAPTGKYIKKSGYMNYNQLKELAIKNL